MPHLRLRTHRVFDPRVTGEQPDPAGAVVRGGRLRRALHRRQQFIPVRRCHQELQTNSTLAVRISSSAATVVSADTPAVRSTSTLVAKPLRTASSAVWRTQ
ncbi:Uncharacterised protein [Mycobacterium tuberculosis]|nr:Uncharacterised protein [Mycobacterium tuberculosis]CKS79881.1 Uncharacterised protein [Mycobacterium tuberculosis]CKT56846.1 Uncharacterised protein [Mycobacterium tuberculosis]